MPENTNNVEQTVAETTKTVMEAVNNSSSITGILIGAGITAGVVLAAWGGSKLYKNHKSKKYIEMQPKTNEEDYEEDYEFEDEEEDAR